MSLQSRVFIRTALAYLLAGFLAGAALLANEGLQIDGRLAVALPAYYHLLTVGWLTQLIFGVAIWMFPVQSRERPRGDERLGWAAYALLNAGLLTRAVAEPLHALSPRPALGWALAAAALLQLAAVWLMVAALWPRVKGRPAPRAPGGG